MKSLTKLLAPAGLVLAAVAATAPVAAQAQGVATADVSRAIIQTTALQTAYQQVNSTYAAQIESRRAKQQELSTLLQPFDSNGNGQLEENELPAVQSSPSFAQVQTLESEIASISGQVNNARIFAVEQILAQYPAALQEVAAAQQIRIVLQPDAVQFAGEGADLTPAITASLNTKVPSVNITPPQGYRPSRQGAQVFQEIQQTLLAAQLLQQQQQAAQQQQGNQQAPQGR
ncbi:OmpH family outer membrane protein [Erythrobacter sp. THAF29]|uniref:OmpH family outer membrane protein n=1 Tax=Erythrobacter sp. THAF29 TaxID=2587851 RepID=UPI001268FCDF|nr:OmpH family outer membrane protein [Erythrobacter sp. THAF29]QFT77449.1 Outer membrane protein (OmpH-like) [Erythrobacter sp. THAF29]